MSAKEEIREKTIAICDYLGIKPKKVSWGWLLETDSGQTIQFHRWKKKNVLKDFYDEEFFLKDWRWLMSIVRTISAELEKDERVRKDVPIIGLSTKKTTINLPNGFVMIKVGHDMKMNTFHAVGDYCKSMNQIKEKNDTRKSKNT